MATTNNNQNIESKNGASQVMKIKTTIMYDRPYLPKGCRKMRYEENVMEVVTNSIRMVTMADVQLAMTAKGYHLYGTHRPVNIYAYKGKLYREAEEQPNFLKENNLSTPLEALVYTHEAYSTYYAKTKRYDVKNICAPENQETREEIIKRLRKDLRGLLIIDGVLYESCACPIYRLVTFGWGGCGTSLSLTSFRYPRNAKVGMRGLYWSALDYEKAIEKANEVAAGRGDRQCVGKFEKLVEVYLPEYVKHVAL